MAKNSSFLGQLGKGFLRSAVNQVGRDGGRVISNQVYGDAHSTPIRGAAQQSPPLNMGYTPQQQQPQMLSIGKEIPVWIIAIICTCGIAAIVGFFKGLKYYNKKTITYKQLVIEDEPIYDQRYKSGIRGYQRVERYKQFDVPLEQSNPADVQRQKNSSMILMAICAVVFVVFAIAISHMPKQ